MDFGSLLSRTWELVWENKFLIVLGIIVAVTSGSGGGGSGGGNFGNYGGPGGFEDTGEEGFSGFDFGEGFDEEDLENLELPDFEELLPALGIVSGFLVAIICAALIIGLVLAYISRVATGAIIAGADQIETTGASSFSQAWKAGWAKGIRLFLIGLVSGIPMIVTIILIVLLAIPLIGVNAQVEDVESLAAANVGLLVTILGLCCVGTLVSLVVSAIRTFADRACVLQEKGVVESYVDGWGVLRDNLGPAVLLFLIQFGIKLVIGLVLILPGIITSVCCFLIPVMWVINGTILAYFTTLWTLAWREWTGGPGEPMFVEQAPAV